MQAVRGATPGAPSADHPADRAGRAPLQIETIGSTDKDPQGALRTIDAEFAATIERLQRIRRELAAILQDGTSASLPEGFAEEGRDLSAADQSLLLIWSRGLDDDAMRDLRPMLVDTPRTAADIALDELPADADRATLRRLGEQCAPVLAAMVEKYPWLNDPGSRARGSASSAEAAVAESVGELYNGAQREVLYRASLISTGSLDALAALEAALPRRGSDVLARGWGGFLSSVAVQR